MNEDCGTMTVPVLPKWEWFSDRCQYYMLDMRLRNIQEQVGHEIVNVFPNPIVGDSQEVTVVFKRLE